MQVSRTLAPLLGLSALGLAFAAPPAAAQTTYFPADTTINYTVNGDAFVGYNQSLNPSSPTVSVVSGGSVQGDMEAYNASTVNISGGSVSDVLWAMQGSTLNVSSGAVGSFLQADSTSAVGISGGTFGQFNGISFLDNTTGPFTFVGTGLSYLPDPGGATPVGGTDYTLIGRLQDGHLITGDVIDVASNATMFTLNNITSVPEPSGAVALGVGAAGLCGLGWRARRRT